MLDSCWGKGELWAQVHAQVEAVSLLWGPLWAYGHLARSIAFENWTASIDINCADRPC